MNKSYTHVLFVSRYTYEKVFYFVFYSTAKIIYTIVFSKSRQQESIPLNTQSNPPIKLLICEFT
jgi:hypothetical protein